MNTRDYSNMPQLALSDKAAISKAKQQILHQEPLIMSLPEEIDMQLNWKDCNCKYDERSEIHYNCDGGKAMSELAKRANHPEFSQLAQACDESSSLVVR